MSGRPPAVPAPRLASLAGLAALGGLVALATLAASPPAAKAEPPAAIASSASADAGAHRAFQRFAEGWMEKLKRVEERNRANPAPDADGSSAQVSYVGYGDEFSVELKPTGYAQAPYVGILRYAEHRYRCADTAARQCELASRSRVTEIFRYQNGRWMH